MRESAGVDRRMSGAAVEGLSPNGSVVDLVQGRLDSLPRQPRAVARYLLTHLDEAVFLTAAELARHARTSESTVVRFAKTLGYRGFPELQAALQALLRQKLAPKERLERAGRLPAGPAALLERIEARAAANLRETRDALVPESLEAAARMIIGAETKYVVGLRASAGTATLLGHYLLQIQPRVRTLTEAGPALFENISALGPGDVVVAVSYPRYTRWTVDCLRVARQRRATSIAITDSRLSPAAQVADLALVGVSESLTFGHSYVSVMFLVDALIGTVVQLDRRRALKQLDTIEQLLMAQEFFYGEVDGKGDGPMGGRRRASEDSSKPGAAGRRSALRDAEDR